MVEETEVGVDHGDAVIVTGGDHAGIVVGSTGTRYKLDSRPGSAVNVVPEGEEGIGGESDSGQL